MKVFPVLYAVLSLCGLISCSTFEDVHYDEQAVAQLKKLANADINAAQPTDNVTLSSLIASQEANQLVTRALSHNPSIQQTYFALKSAEQQLIGTRANQLPSLVGDVTSTKDEGSTSYYTPSLTVSWTIDIWQQLANNTSSQQATLLANAHAYQGARDLLAAKVIQSYLSLVQAAQLITIESQHVARLAINENIIVSRYRKGLSDLKDLDSAKSSTQSSRASLVAYQTQYQTESRHLALLTGETEISLIYQLKFPEVFMPLSELSQQNLSRRPDLQQAYQAIIASQYQHKVAYKALLPTLSLSTSLSNSQTSLHDALFGSSAWQLLGNLSAPLFNAGALQSEVEVAKLDAEKSYWAFQESLLIAVNEVDNAIAQEISLNQQLTFTQSALTSALRSEKTYLERYRSGSVSLLDLLTVQEQTFSLQAEVSQLTYQQLSNRITLGLALGLGV
ncbi:MAG: TolC family protein [Colwellia sp.]|nr:TolC family protein [Colwellia sp.]